MKKNIDPRTPTSIHQCGAVTVRIYDEALYAAHIALYYSPEETTTPAKRSTRSTARAYKKQKPIARFWARKKRVVAIEDMVKAPS